MAWKFPTIGDLPADWYTKHGEEITRRLVQESWTVWQDIWRGHLIKFNDHYWRTLPFLDDETLSREPMELKHATQLVNRVAFCHIVSPQTSQWDSGNFTGHPRRWMHEALNTWDSLRSEEAKKDDVLPFACVRWPKEDCAAAGGWLGLGMTSSIEESDVPAIREEALDRLIERHRQLCDLVQERVRGPAQPDDEDWLRYQGGVREKWISQPALLPTCRAVLCISTVWQSEAGTVLLVLTGDNDQLCSGAPTFADIPAPDIVEMRRPTVVEVTLATAIWFLACIEAAETAANNELQRIFSIRRADMDAQFFRKATARVQRVQRMWREEQNNKNLTDLEYILRSVLGNEIEPRCWEGEPSCDCFCPSCSLSRAA